MTNADVLPAETLATEPPARRSTPFAMFALLVCAAVVGGMTFLSYWLSKNAGPFLFGPYDLGRYKLTIDLHKHWSFMVVIVCVLLIITFIAVVRLHAFLALILAAISAGLMSPIGSLNKASGAFGMKPAVHWIQAIEITAAEFGKTAGGIGIVVALAAIIGICLLTSGSADKVVRRFLAVFGEKHAGFALLLATYIISIPIFFDTLFMLLVPIAQALYVRTKKDYMLFVLAICTAGIITHSMVIPHPGPLAMVEELNKGSDKVVVDIGLSILMGLGSGVMPLLFGWVLCRVVNRVMVVHPPESLIGPDVAKSLDRPESELPSFLAAVTPVILPVILIAGSSFAKAFITQKQIDETPWLQTLLAWLSFVGERHVALLIGAAIAILVLMRQSRTGIAHLGSILNAPLETAGVIILITAAGGAFGAMLRNSGVGDAIKASTGGLNLNLIYLSFLVAVVIRVAQGSATVAMMTTVGIVAPLMHDALKTGSLPYHPVYLFLSIGYGAFFCSWMNDSGFWVVSRLSGMTERQTLKSWTVMSIITSLAGLGATLLLAHFLPLK